jgi:hypothetical protein
VATPVAIDAAQTYWLRCSEVLRPLDLAIKLARRGSEEMLPKRLACEVELAISDWLSISFMIFLSSEGTALQGIRDFGEWKLYAFQRFKGILDLTAGASLETQSAIPPWAAEKVKESWNEQEPRELAETGPHSGTVAKGGRRYRIFEYVSFKLTLFTDGGFAGCKIHGRMSATVIESSAFTPIPIVISIMWVNLQTQMFHGALYYQPFRFFSDRTHGSRTHDVLPEDDSRFPDTGNT